MAVFQGLSPSEMAHTCLCVCVCVWSVFVSKLVYFLSITLSLPEVFLRRDIKNLSFHPDTECVISLKRPRVQISI